MGGLVGRGERWRLLTRHHGVVVMMVMVRRCCFVSGDRFLGMEALVHEEERNLGGKGRRK